MTMESLATPITTHSKTVEATPTLDTSAYASGDRLGTVMELDVGRSAISNDVTLADVFVLDKAKQSQSIDILFFKSAPTVASADNAAIDITDAEMEKCIGSVSLSSSDYKALANSSYVNPDAFNKVLSPTDGSTKIYALAVCRSGTPTYAASSLVFKFKFFQD